MSNSRGDFEVWLDQEVWTIGVQRMSRRDYIPEFAEDLTQFMKYCGYVMDMRWKSGQFIVAKWMYIIHVQEFITRKYNEPIKYANIIHRDWQEDYNEYLHSVDFDKISSFMERWKLYEDFDPDTRIGQRILHELQTLLYYFIDMNNSKNGIRIAEEESESDSDDLHKRKDDIYLMEAREGMHGGRGSKV